MPKLIHQLPRLCKHKHTKQAYVIIHGKQIYFGKWGEKTTDQAYTEWCMKFLNNGRQIPAQHGEMWTVADLIAAYLLFAKGHFVKAGKPTTEYVKIKAALQPLLDLYDEKPVADFGSVELDVVLAKMVHTKRKDGTFYMRNTINANLTRIRKMFKWGVRKGQVQPDTIVALKTVEGLEAGKTSALEAEGVEPVTLADIRKTLPALSKTVRAMVQFQHLTACRPGEVCQLRPCDIDRSDDVWIFKPEHHKNEHRGKSRLIFIGPKAQKVIKPFFDRGDKDYCFFPREREHDKQKRRKTARACRLLSEQERFQSRYFDDTYRQAVRRACVKAGVEHWSPNQLRHTRATEINHQYSLEEAALLLGHSIPGFTVTQMYAKPNLNKAKDIMRKIG